MDLSRIAELNLSFKHRHDDGTFGTFEPELSHHSPSGPHTRHDRRIISAPTTFNECVNGRHYLRNMK